MQKNILVFLDELFYTINNQIYKSKFVSLNFLKRFEEQYKNEFKFYYSFPVYNGNIDNYGSFIENQNNIYPINGWHNIISFYKKYFIFKKELIALVNNLYKKVDVVFIRIPSPAGLILGEEFTKRGVKVIYNVVGDIKEAYNNYKFPLNIPAYFLSQYLYRRELSQKGMFLTVGSELTNRFKDKNAIYFIDSLISNGDLKKVKSNFTTPINVLYVGRLLESKGIFFLIDVINEIKEEFNIILNIVGFGKEEEKVKQLAKTYEFIKFYGKISDRNKLNDIYLNSDIFVLSTINSEGFPRVILEAWANGLYVISSKVGGIKGLGRDKDNILFFTPNNKEELIENIRNLINNENLRKSLKDGITKIQKKITFEYYSKILYKILKGY